MGVKRKIKRKARYSHDAKGHLLLFEYGLGTIAEYMNKPLDEVLTMVTMLVVAGFILPMPVDDEAEDSRASFMVATDAKGVRELREMTGRWRRDADENQGEICKMVRFMFPGLPKDYYSL